MNAIVINNLTKKFKNFTAVDKLNLSIRTTECGYSHSIPSHQYHAGGGRTIYKRRTES